MNVGNFFNDYSQNTFQLKLYFIRNNLFVRKKQFIGTGYVLGENNLLDCDSVNIGNNNLDDYICMI